MSEQVLTPERASAERTTAQRVSDGEPELPRPPTLATRLAPLPQPAGPDANLSGVPPDGAVSQLRLAERWPLFLLALAIGLYVLVFWRGLGWQWAGILTASKTDSPVVAAPAPPPASRQAAGAPAPARAANTSNTGSAGNTGSTSGAAPAPATGSRQPLPPTNEPPPRNTTDSYGVRYDENGVAVLGIDADPSGVYNVAPGRQLRIGGPGGQLFDVLPGGQLSPASRIKEWPR